MRNIQREKQLTAASPSSLRELWNPQWNRATELFQRLHARRTLFSEGPAESASTVKKWRQQILNS
jgi:hypothetical protein